MDTEIILVIACLIIHDHGHQTVDALNHSLSFLTGAWGDGQNMVVKRATSTSTNGSGQQQVFTGIKKPLEKKSSLYIASFIFCHKDPQK